MPYYEVTLKRTKTQRVRVIETARILMKAASEDQAIEAAAKLAEARPGRVFAGDEDLDEKVLSSIGGESWVEEAEETGRAGSVETFSARKILR